MRTVVQGCAVATVDGSFAEYADGHVVVSGNRLVAVGPGPFPGRPSRATGSSTDAAAC
jgi:hypothetical protein